jgi:ApaG protein
MASQPSPTSRPAADTGAYAATTRGLKVAVTPRFVPEQSDAARGRYLWAYTVRLENTGEETVQLITRHWVITDGLGRVEEVRGPGVVGEQPILAPGQSYEYTSACPLGTASGAMQGSYGMVTAAGERFDAVIPAFSLHLPDAARRLN